MRMYTRFCVVGMPFGRKDDDLVNSHVCNMSQNSLTNRGFPHIFAGVDSLYFEFRSYLLCNVDRFGLFESIFADTFIFALESGSIHALK
jgi:hypothetical protein